MAAGKTTAQAAPGGVLRGLKSAVQNRVAMFEGRGQQAPAHGDAVGKENAPEIVVHSNKGDEKANFKALENWVERDTHFTTPDKCSPLSPPGHVIKKDPLQRRVEELESSLVSYQESASRACEASRTLENENRALHVRVADLERDLALEREALVKVALRMMWALLCSLSVHLVSLMVAGRLCPGFLKELRGGKKAKAEEEGGGGSQGGGATCSPGDAALAPRSPHTPSGNV